MALVAAAKNLMLDYLGTRVVYVSAHDGDPSTTGANELTGGSPSYARVAIAWSSASAGSMSDSTNGAEFNVPAGRNVTHIGFWSASTSGTFYGSDDVTRETFASQGTYRLTNVDLSISDA